MPSKFSDWNKEKGVISYNKGFVNYKLMQNSSYEKLGPIQVLETVPDFLFENYLQNKVCLSDLTKAVNCILHPINRRTSSDGIDFGLTMVGFIRRPYFDQIKDRDYFYFYFYDKDGYKELALHPELINCSKFIGFENDNSNKRIIRGTVSPTIKKLKGSELKTLLESEHISKTTEYKPSYYCIKIENIQEETFSNEQFQKLMKNVNESRGNFLLDKSAPKVIEHE